MTLAEVRKLSDEELRLKVAGLCKWESKFLYGSDNGQIGISSTNYSKMPDYSNDLNAMHEAVESLGAELGAYEYWLENIAGAGMCMVEATARQRAEAFVMSFSS